MCDMLTFLSPAKPGSSVISLISQHTRPPACWVDTDLQAHWEKGPGHANHAQTARHHPCLASQWPHAHSSAKPTLRRNFGRFKVWWKEADGTEIPGNYQEQSKCPPVCQTLCCAL